MQEQQHARRALASAKWKYTLLRFALMAASLALCSALPFAHAQAETAPAATDASFLPAPEDIVATLRAQFRVSAADALTIAQAVLTEANRYSMSPVLLLSVMAVESGFDPRAVSTLGARGLMQVLPAAHPRAVADVRQLDDPAINVRIGSSILRGYLDESGGDIDAALLRYSGGGKGYARRVALRMQRFNATLRGNGNAQPLEKVSLGAIR
ncbi:Soluble lytic murein transglycosylase [Paraburkholderia piptadeniae]|uniref:Soluble lytic murein transglycosylase n=1 Tax=Paraburkholderia piptadeniae TaxID=1701573 RepID=A0A1N7RNW8_9BURK|nr:lytic transglycosylase domain-containing protein [Paraburkholderia piptadeniae]SIT36783.1 Soluble lytic murein transglycosylase [Paraburkholderia piptadeniae]